MTRPKKRRTRDAELARGRTVKNTKHKKRRTRDAELARGRTVKNTKHKKRRTSETELEGPEGKSVPSDFLAYRLEGGAPPTPEAYAHAVEQWQQLSGAVLSRTRISPTLVRPSTAVPTLTNDKGSEEQPS